MFESAFPPADIYMGGVEDKGKQGRTLKCALLLRVPCPGFPGAGKWLFWYWKSSDSKATSTVPSQYIHMSIKSWRSQRDRRSSERRLTRRDDCGLLARGADVVSHEGGADRSKRLRSRTAFRRKGCVSAAGRFRCNRYQLGRR